MRKYLPLIVLCLISVSGSAFSQNADFTLVNRTGYPIRELYVNPSKSKNWGEDKLGRHTIENGESWKLSFPQSRSQCIQDIMIVFDDDDSEVIWERFDLCEIRKITLRYNRKTNETTAISE
jgi:hypothetical protein